MLLANKKTFLPQVKNIFASRTHVFLPKHVSQFSHHEKMLTMIPNNVERTTMADGKVEVEEPQAGHRKGKEGKELEGRGD